MSSELFPKFTCSYIKAFQFSSWYSKFSEVTPTAAIIRPLNDDFRNYLEDNGVFVPEGSDDLPSSPILDSRSSDSDEGEDEGDRAKSYSFPSLDAQIREAISKYGAVFPKLNWTSPRDASWLLPTLKCTTPADVYLLLKSSDFISHDIDPSLVFAGCDESEDEDEQRPYELELVLKKWYSMDPSREFRCFVREETLLAIVQRDSNYYSHLNGPETQRKIIGTVSDFWKGKIRNNFPGGGDYIFDLHLTRDLSSAYILDFNPFHPKTDSLLVTYDEISEIRAFGQTQPCLITVPSPSHPSATRNAPAHQHNAIPYDALQLSGGVDVVSFVQQWENQLRLSTEESDSEDQTQLSGNKM